VTGPRARLVSAALCLFGSLAACGSGFLEGIAGGAAPDAGPAAFDAGPECVGAVPPERPDVPDSPEDRKLSFAFRSLRVNAGGPRGLNLDRTCTCPDRETCALPDAGAARKPACDGEEGRDLATTALFDRAAIASTEFREDFGTTRIQGGLFTVLVDLFGWNGQPDDPSVTVRLMMSQGFDEVLSAKAGPTFDGTDVWTVDPGSIRGGDGLLDQDCRSTASGARACVPRLADVRAYVRGGVLVADLVDRDTGTAAIVVRAAAGRLVFDLVQAKLVAKIVEDPRALYRLEGEITGRWPVRSLLATVANIEDPLRPGRALCESEVGLYREVKALACELVDIAADPAEDRTGAPCGALSSALSFVATPAAPGRVINRDRSRTECADWKDDCTNP